MGELDIAQTHAYNDQSARPCGCDPGAHWTCQGCREKQAAEVMADNAQRAPLTTIKDSGERVTCAGNNPAFTALLQRMAELHNRKNHDYAEGGNPYSNFEQSASVAGCSVDTVFRVMIGVKLARLKELLGGKTPLHESIDDSKLDLAMYAALWVSYGMKQEPK